MAHKVLLRRVLVCLVAAYVVLAVGAQGDSCVTDSGFLGDCQARARCEDGSNGSSCSGGGFCCTRITVSSDPAASTQLNNDRPIVFPASERRRFGQVGRRRPNQVTRPPPSQSTRPRPSQTVRPQPQASPQPALTRPTLLRPNFECGGQGPPSQSDATRRRRRSPQKSESGDFAAFWQEYQRRVAVGEADAGYTRQDLMLAYQEAQAELQAAAEATTRRWTCGSVLISRRHMLTAAHCLEAGQPEVVRLGDRELSSDNEDAAPAEYRVIRVTPHPAYQKPAVYNDLAVLTLDREVVFSRHVKPFCLYGGDPSSLVNLTSHVSGWGATEFGGGLSDSLMGGNLTVWSQERCDSVYSNTEATGRLLPLGVTSSLLCAGGAEQDACQGDSGGPMTVLTPAGTRLVGVVSSGIGCATLGVPGLYTNVAHYVDWIDSIVYGEQ